MIDESMLNYIVQNGFAISVAIFLLYKDAKFNEKVAEVLNEVVAACKKGGKE